MENRHFYDNSLHLTLAFDIIIIKMTFQHTLIRKYMKTNEFNLNYDGKGSEMPMPITETSVNTIVITSIIKNDVAEREIREERSEIEIEKLYYYLFGTEMNGFNGRMLTAYYTNTITIISIGSISPQYKEHFKEEVLL